MPEVFRLADMRPVALGLAVITAAMLLAPGAPLARVGRFLGVRGGEVRSFATRVSEPVTRTPLETYETLAEKLRTLEHLGGIEGLLGWDEQTKMPPGAAAARAAQKVALAKVVFAEKTSPDLGAMLDALEAPEAQQELASAERAAVVREARRQYDQATKVTEDLIAKEADVESRGFNTWQEARGKDDWDMFKPVLKEMLEIKNAIAAIQRPDLVKAGQLYDAHVDRFERNMSAERLAEVFEELKAGLVPLLKSIQASPVTDRAFPDCLKDGDQWEVAQQEALCREVATDLGFDFSRGRFDVSSHPFTGGPHSSDTRITTRYSSDNWLEGIAATVHETGHALYEQGRRNAPDDAFRDLPVTRALSMGVHESQSLIWERMVFQSRAFWDYMTPKLHKFFPHTAEATAEDLYAFVNKVKPGLIRVDADEVSYPLHIIMRYELEREFVEGDTQGLLNRLPETWNQRMRDDLGVEVPSNAKGCLQDVHWSVGAVGYFPSYSLGSIMAAQLFAAAKKDLPLDEQIAAGDFQPLRDWLAEKIHRRGSFPQSLDELLEEVTGEKLNPTAYLTYLQSKYAALYEL